MNPATRGLAWCCTFLVLDAVQAVFFGGLFQKTDSFLIGALVFGGSAVACLTWTAARNPGDLGAALAAPGPLAGLNVTAAGAWIAYLIAIQLIEPAVAFTLFSGVIPLAAIAARRLGFPETPGVRNRVEAAGYALLALGMLALAVVTLAGWSGFVRGGLPVAVAGVALAALSGALIAGMLLYSKQLDRAGVGPVAQFGLRFPLYVVLAVAGFLLGFDDKGAVPPATVATAVAAGLVLLAFPIYAVQKAVSLTSTATIGTFAAVGPLIVFLLQMVEGRVDYAGATLAGLLVYFAGALVGVFGSVRAAT